MERSVLISPNFTVGHWLDIRPALGSPTARQWHYAIEILNDRIYGRFIEPVDKIQELEYSGFAVMALDCLLIDTIQSFKEGRVRGNVAEQATKKSFLTFLRTSRHFSAAFNSNQKASDFFNDVRCGLLHDGETRRNWRIWAKSDESPNTLLEKRDESTIVYRKTFHGALKHEFKDFLVALADPRNRSLRTNFLKRMDAICHNHVAYFAYGSNMEPSRLTCRGITEALPIGGTSLSGYRLTFNKHSADGSDKANIEPHDESEVWGGLYRMTVAEREQLGGHEPGYKPETVRVTREGASVTAVTFIAATVCTRECPPTAQYMEFVLRGAEFFGLPDWYRQQLAAIPTQG